MTEACKNCYTEECHEACQKSSLEERAEVFAEITQKMAAVYKAKNHDYGDSFEKVRSKFPTAILVRLNDKLNRLETLMGGEVAQVKEESIDDTLLDLANYAVMELTARRMERVNH